MNDTLKALGILFLRTVVLSMALAYLMAIAEGLRTTGVLPYYFPFSPLVHDQARLINAAVAKDPLALKIDDFLYAFNCAFPAATRMGQGLGMISAAFWSMHSTSVKQNASLIERVVIGALAGAIIGFRLPFVVIHNPKTILFTTLIGMVGFSIYLVIAGRKKPIPSIPIVEFR